MCRLSRAPTTSGALELFPRVQGNRVLGLGELHLSLLPSCPKPANPGSPTVPLNVKLLCYISDELQAHS